jgi:replicative DNA helicase
LKAQPVRLLEVDEQHSDLAVSEQVTHRIEHAVAIVAGKGDGLAVENANAVLAIAQLSRRVEKSDDKRPNLADLRECGAIEQDADLIILLYREAYYLERTKCSDAVQEEKRIARLGEVQHFLEQRNGPTDLVKLYCNIGCNAVRNLARGAP